MGTRGLSQHTGSTADPGHFEAIVDHPAGVDLALLRFQKGRGAEDEAEALLMKIWKRMAAATNPPVVEPVVALYLIANALMNDRAHTRRLGTQPG